jgi:hypothetical protein
MSRFFLAVGMICLSGLATTHAAPLLDDVQLVADTVGATNPIPPAQVFNIAKTGSYTVTLKDLELPAALATLSVAIADSANTAVTLSAAGTKTVTLKAGSYTAQVLALAASGAVGGTFSVQLTPAGGGTPAWQYEDAVGAASPAPSSGQSVLSTQFSVAAAGTYQLTVADLAFPVALDSLQLIVLNHCGTTPGCVTAPVSPTPSTGSAISEALQLAAGTYDLFVVAEADSTALQGLYSIQIAQGGTSAYAATVPVGELPAASPIKLAAAATVSLKLVDLGAPATLSSLQAIAAQGASVLRMLPAAGTYSFAADAGTVQLYVLAQPGAGGQGAFEAYATSGSAVVADIAQPAVAAGSFGYVFPTTLAASGSYQAGIYDFQLPQSFSSLNAVVAQGGSVLANTQSSSSQFEAAAGPVSILVFPALSSAMDNGLFGVQLVGPGAGGATAFETTQAVGALFSSHSFTVTTAGSYDLTLSDLGFPAKFGSLAVIATRGYTTAGEVFGNETLPISATPGTYVLNVLAQVGSGVDYGMYGLNVTPAPTVTLVASASSVASGGQTTLTWSSSNTTSCVASASPSASGWSGTLAATSGSQSTGVLNADTTFTITCTGAVGTTAKAAAAVAVTAEAKSGGGGGALTTIPLLWLLVAMIGVVWRRHMGCYASFTSRTHACADRRP